MTSAYKDFYDEHKFTNIPIEKVHEFDYISEWIGRNWQRRGRKPFNGQDLVDLMLSNGYTKFLEEKATEMLRSSAEASEGDL